MPPGLLRLQARQTETVIRRTGTRINLLREKPMRTIWALLALPLWTACATAPLPSESALRVQVHRQTSNLLDRCKRLEPVSVRGQGSMGMTQSPVEIATINAELRVRELVANAGGDTVVFLSPDLVSFQPGMPAVATVQVHGVGFRCH